MEMFFGLFEFIIFFVIILAIKSKKQKRNEEQKRRSSDAAGQAVRGALTNAMLHGHDHFGDAHTEDVIHATLDSAKGSGLINLNGKLYTKDQLKGI